MTSLRELSEKTPIAISLLIVLLGATGSSLFYAGVFSSRLSNAEVRLDNVELERAEARREMTQWREKQIQIVENLSFIAKGNQTLVEQTMRRVERLEDQRLRNSKVAPATP